MICPMPVIRETHEEQCGTSRIRMVFAGKA